MIRINEIMYGDFFRVNRDGLCIKNGTIVQVRGVDGECKLEVKRLVGAAKCHPLDKYQFDGGIWVDYLDPIPLTAEILEKNGFTQCEPQGYDLYVKDKDGRGLYHILWQSEPYDYLEIAAYTCPFGEFNKSNIKYVHQLQHALRLCGISKEIVL